MKAITINTSKRDFFRYYMGFLNPIFNLRNRELDVLADLLYWNDFYKGSKVKIREKMVFDFDTKQDIMAHLSMSRESLDNHLGALRKKGFLKDKKIVKKYQFYYDTHNVLAFQFLLTGE